MSVSKWAYTPWKCDGQPCPGDCDHCPKAYEDESDKPTDLISKKEVINYARKCADGYSYIELPIDAFVDGINALPSADADGEDLIIKGAKGIQDGLYNIKDGKLFKYKAKGGTVRTYPIVPSAEAEWIPCSERLPKQSGTYLTTTAKGSVCTDHFYANSNDICGRHWSYHRRREPIAWKPLPKPYREDGEI